MNYFYKPFNFYHVCDNCNMMANKMTVNDIEVKDNSTL